MKNKKHNIKVLVAYNGLEFSDPNHANFISEAEVKRTAEYVFETANAIGFSAELISVSNISSIISTLEKFSPDIVFNLCEGWRGDSDLEMNVAALWELLGLPFTGNRAKTLAISQDKPFAKAILAEHGILVPKGEVFSRVPAKTKLKFPLIAKPAREDASLGIGTNPVLENIKDLKRKVEELLFEYQQPILVEEFIDGREFNAAIVGTVNPTILPISEIDFTHLDQNYPRVTSYEAKWIEDSPLYQKTPSVCPAQIPAKLAGKISSIALDVFRILEGKDYGRVDFRVNQEGEIFVLEYNPNPAIAPDSGFHKALNAAGLSFGDFIESLVFENLGIVKGSSNSRKNQRKYRENKKNVA
ncbi:MAG: D-alanine--D-alanine ligase [Candidatus Nanoarchaeia archaeon]